MDIAGSGHTCPACETRDSDRFSQSYLTDTEESWNADIGLWMS